MKSLSEIYNSIIDKFSNKTKLDIAKGSVLDSYVLASSDAIRQAYNEIETNKTPHIFTKLEGSNIDSMGMLVGCARRPGEADEDYKYRMLSWNTSNQASNSTAIEAALQNMTYSSNVTYVPLTQGVGTATAYIIPKKLDKETIESALNETKERLEKVVSKSAYIEYIIPKLLKVDLLIYISIIKDEKNVMKNITSKIENYINNIAPGDKLEVGEINKIGVEEPNVNYFSVSTVIVDEDELQGISITQKLEEKLLFNEIIWNKVVNE